MTHYMFSGVSASRQAFPAAGQNVTVVLFGEVLADVFPDRTVLGGAPFNVARHLKAFGLNPVLISRLGDDALRDEVLRVMTQNGMETQGIQFDKHHPTGRVQVHIEDGKHRFEILPLQAYDFIHPAVVRMSSLSADPALVYFGTLAQRQEISERALRALVRSTAAAKFLDINLRAPWYDERTLRQSLEYADIAKLNAEELGVVAEMFGLPEGDPKAQARELIGRFGLERVMVTCGEGGAWQIDRDGEAVEAGAEYPATSMVDTVGAGDGFSAVTILGTLRGWPAVMALRRANAFAAAICGIRGAVPDHADFYTPFIEEWGI